MTKIIIYLILLMSINPVCFSQNKTDNVINACYREKIRLNVKERELKDTVVTFRNYIKGCDDKRIMCSNSIIDNDIEKLIWESKYIAPFLEFQHKQNRFSIISYKTDSNNCTIVRYFWCYRDSKVTIEMRRLKVQNKKIIGIYLGTGSRYIDGFQPIEEFDNPVYHHVSPIMK